MGRRPSTKTSKSSTKQPYFCTEMISPSYSSPRCSSMNWAVFQSISSRSAPLARRSASDVWEAIRSEEHTSELQSPCNLVCRLLLEKKKKYRRHSSLYRLWYDQ